MAFKYKLLPSKNINSSTIRKIVDTTQNSLPPYAPALIPQDSKVENFSSSFFVQGTNQTFSNIKFSSIVPEDPKPQIICSSEYFNLFDDEDKLNKTGEALLLKEASKILNAKVVATYISQSNDIKNIFEVNEQEINSFIDKQALDSSESFLKKKSGKNLLNLRLFSSNSTSTLLNFNNILNQNGYSNEKISTFSNTKIWQQSLIYFKRNLFSYSEKFLGDNEQGFLDSRSKLENFIDLNDISGNPKYIFNFFKYSDIPLNTTTPDEKIYTLNVLENFSKNTFIDYNNRQTINLDVNNFSQNLKFSNIHYYFHNLLKEILFSSAINNLNSNDKLYLSTRGFDLESFSGKQKFNVWDPIIGSFTENAYSIPENIQGSLADLSRNNTIIRDELGNSQTIKVLTFENQTSGLRTLNITPGSQFYIDGSFYAKNQTDQSQRNIFYLKQKVDDSISSFSLLKKVSSYTKISEEFVPDLSQIKNSSIIRLLPSLIKPKQLYSSLINYSSNPTFNIENIKALNTNDLKKYQYGVRSPSLIIKSSFVGRHKDTDLKYWIFILLISRSYHKNYFSNDTNYDKNISTIKDQIFRELESISSNVDYQERISRFNKGNSIPYRFAEPDSSFAISDSSSSSYEDNILNISKKGKELSKEDLFNLEDQDSLWNIISEIFCSILSIPIWDSDSTGDPLKRKTTYSAIDQMIFCYICFEAISYTISHQTPEDLNGVLRYSYRKDDISNITLVDMLDVSSQDSNILNSFNVKVSEKTIDPKYISESIAKTTQELKNNSDHFLIYEDFISRISQYTTELMSYFGNSSYLDLKQSSFNLFDQIGISDISNRNKLYNFSLIDSQVNLKKYHESELKDRILRSFKSDNVSEKMKNYLNFDSKICRYLPINELDLISANLIIDNFKTLKSGYNSRILSIGLQPGLIDNFSTSKKTLLKIKIYKINNKIPELVYKPKEYWFDTARFVNKSIFNDFSTWKNVATKVVDPSGIIVHEKYNEKIFYGSPFIDYSSFTSLQKEESYKNCVESFYIEEYLRWFTGIRFCESTFENISGISPPNRSLPPEVQEEENTQYINISDSVFEYFSKNETFGMNLNDLKKKIIHPKKFDRVFNLIVSPEDFEIDEITTLRNMDNPRSFNDLVKQNQLQEIKITEETYYKDFPTSLKSFSDASFDEYIVSVEI